MNYLLKGSLVAVVLTIVCLSKGDIILAQDALVVTRGTDTLMIIKADTTVGIGTVNPGEKLSVQGIIESLIGGIKFPDGTIQTTAASSDSNSWKLTGNSGPGFRRQRVFCLDRSE